MRFGFSVWRVNSFFWRSVVRGWVYVMTNMAMPGLVKVGFSTKDPQLRAQELNGTGLPHPFVVAYDALLEDPRMVEQRVHRELKQHHEAKEFFRVSVNVAIQAIDRVLLKDGQSTLLSNLRHRAEPADIALDTAPRKALAVRAPEAVRKGINCTAHFLGFCGYCGKEFELTLTRHDSGAVCPCCFKRNDVSEFLRVAFPF